MQSMHLSSEILQRKARGERFFYHDELRNLCGIPDSESIVAEILVGKA
jgi:hypothetical protein